MCEEPVRPGMMTQSPAACNTRALRYPVCVWSIDQIADFMAESVMAENLRLRAEDAVAGVDALDETALHPVIASYFSRCGLGVLREHHFPTPKRARPRNSERERCDLVLTHDPAGVLIDPVEVDRREHELAVTLFAPVAEQAAALAGTASEDALWIELKVCGQYEFVAGVPIANTAYTTGVVRGPAVDIRKLSREKAIEFAAATLILFAQDEPTARHDLQIAAHKWLDQSLPIREPIVRVVPIDERIGNTVAAVCMIPARCGGDD